VDNLISIGVGDEAERLRKISNIVEKEYPELIQAWDGNPDIPVYLPAFFEKVWEIAYAKNPK
jgi:hypothetical protein